MATSSTTRKLEDIFTCCLCFEQYNTTVNIPKALPCQHTFCAPCLDKFTREVDENGEEPQCPKCKAGFIVPRGGARELPTNFSVQDMIELKLHQETPPQDSARKSKEEAQHFTCNEHVDRCVIMVCLKCEIGLCIDCIKTLNKSEHNEHAREDIESYLSSYKDALNALKVNSDMLPALYDRAQKAADKRLAHTKQKRDQEINREAECAIQKVKKWQETQKSVTYEPKFLWFESAARDASIDDIKRVTSNVEAFDNSDSEKLPSLRGTKGVMDQLQSMEKKCQKLSNRKFCAPAIEPIEVVIKTGKK